MRNRIIQELEDAIEANAERPRSRPPTGIEIQLVQAAWEALKYLKKLDDVAT